jgi:3-oxoacyl-[acyl-carrier protein] reductase
LSASDQGRIVAITSTVVREPIVNLALSNAVRPGVVGYLKTLAGELAKSGITVNSIAAGRISTARTEELFGPEPPASELAAIPAGRFGTAREVGDVVAFLCSRRASYVTGTMIAVDGGPTRSLFSRNGHTPGARYDRFGLQPRNGSQVIPCAIRDDARSCL